MKAYRLYLIRHGITQGNLDGRYIGSTDLPLCEEGIKNIESLRDNFEYPKVQKVYTSPLMRSVQTANIIYPDAWTVTVDALKEMDFGEFENRSMQDLSADPSFKTWIESNMATAPKNGETKEQFSLRICKGFESILMDMMKNEITAAALVGHIGVFASLLAQFGMPRRSPLEWQIEPGEGVSLLTSAQMWSRDRMLEVFDPLPYGKQEMDNPYSGILNIGEDDNK